MDRKDDKIIKFPSDFMPKKPNSLTSEEFEHLNAKLEMVVEEIVHLSTVVNKLTMNLKKILKEK